LEVKPLQGRWDATPARRHAVTATRFRRQLTVLAAMAVVVCGVMTAVALTGSVPADQRWYTATGYLFTVAVPIAAGLVVWHLRPENRFGPLLVATGFAWSVTALASADNSFLYSVGRVSLWLVEPGVLYLMLAFPAGRLVARADRVLFAASVAIVALLFLPTAFLIETFPKNSPLASCDANCPANFFSLVDSTPAFVDPVRLVREILIVLVFVAVAIRLVHRIRHSSRLLRRTVTPVLTAGIVRLGAYVAFIPTRRLVPDSAAVDAIGWVLLLSLPAIALGFLVGLVRWRLHVADAMEQLARSVMARPSPANLRAAMGAALEDPTLEVAYWVPGDHGRWVGPDGLSFDVDHPGSSRAVTTVTDNGQPAVALIHDPALTEQQDFVDAAASLAIFATENERLTARLRSSLRELEQSRARILAAADRERRRIERDLHDGAQQRLVALRIKLELAEELMDTDSLHARRLLHETESEIEEALEQVRSLARGIYPSLLAERGLSEALRAATLRVPLPTRLDCGNVPRYPAEVESAVYFSCLEAVQNAVKHARGATALGVSVSVNGGLRFAVSDDGEGFDTAETAFGQGLTNMRDRLAAVGGRLEIRSGRGHSTVVSGTVTAEPLDGGVLPAEPWGRRAPLRTHMPAVWRA